MRFIWIALSFDKILIKSTTEKNPTENLPRVSIVVPARNEGIHIENCLKALQQQTYKNLEVILVNDRSEDCTAEVMKNYALTSPDWHYLEIKTLPKDQWLGKNHALHQGGKIATGEYIIFTDGDVIYKPETIQKTISSVIENNLDHLVLSAHLKATDKILIAMQALFSIGFVSMLKLHKLGKSPNSYVGAGVFNLVKTSLYRSIGGHESIRLEVIDDLMLGKIMVLAGGKPGFMDGHELISVEWYADWKKMILGLEKNSFASLRYSLPKLFLFLLVMWGIYLTPYFGVFLFSFPINCIFGLVLILSHGVMAEVSRRTGHSVFITLLLPVAAILLGFAFFRSAYITITRNAVTWRDTSYPLKLLKDFTKL